jgi:hypothetical protein
LNEEDYYEFRANNELHHYAQYISWLSAETTKPSVLYKPELYIDGDKWCALYGINIQDGCCGFGNSPQEAMDNFDKAFYASFNKKCNKR